MSKSVELTTGNAGSATIGVGMLESYKKSLTPGSMLDVVPAEVLQGLMQGFFFGHRAGMVLIYDDGTDKNGRPVLKRLEPVSADSRLWRGVFENFNPFCAKFRQDPNRNLMCQACDIERARKVYTSNLDGIRYECHMGLIDMTIPVKINGQVRGVIYGGQKIRDDADSVDLITLRVLRKASNTSSELLPLIEQFKQSPDQLDSFELAFREFAITLQSTVDNYHKGMKDNARRIALLEVSEELGRAPADDPTAWEMAAAQLLNELQELAGRAPVWLLVRRGSKYECIATTSGSHTHVALRVAKLIDTPVDTLVSFTPRTSGEVAASIRSATGKDYVTLIRSDCTVSATETASVILLVGTTLADTHKELFVGCCQVLSYPAGITLLFQKLERQKEDFEKATAFAGHHLKTPVQAAKWVLEEAIALANKDPQRGSQYKPLIQSAMDQMSLGLADAALLMSSTEIHQLERINIIDLLDTLQRDFQSIARRRAITLRWLRRPTAAVYVLAIDYQLRVAFSNLFDNAIKYSYEGKTVDVSVSIVHTAGAGKRSGQPVVRVEIQDFGVGFSEQEREELFDFGVRVPAGNPARERPGQGIGLWQARTLIEAAGGTLDIESIVVIPKSPTSGGMHRVTALCHLPKAK